MKNTAAGISPNGRVSARNGVRLLKCWSFQIGKKFIILELFNKNVVIKNQKYNNETSIVVGVMLIRILTLTAGDL